tara:strand:- start:944 stop:1087 length:144 start_codon:yes stop_codon:yes gene_type:complete
VFLKALTDYDKLILDSVAIELKGKIRSKKENESSDMLNESDDLLDDI